MHATRRGPGACVDLIYNNTALPIKRKTAIIAVGAASR
jgi:hypothetical protein